MGYNILCQGEKLLEVCLHFLIIIYFQNRDNFIFYPFFDQI